MLSRRTQLAIQWISALQWISTHYGIQEIEKADNLTMAGGNHAAFIHPRALKAKLLLRHVIYEH